MNTFLKFLAFVAVLALAAGYAASINNTRDRQKSLFLELDANCKGIVTTTYTIDDGADVYAITCQIDNR